MMITTPRAAAIHDLSGIGRCSLTVALPILSAMGVQCSVLPTAYLSAHTAFPDFTFLDMTDEMKKTVTHWKQLGLRFDAVYSGFLGGVEQIDIVADFIRDFRREGGLAVVDPVMGDNGRRYVTYTDEMCDATRRLAEKADVITPNLTEAAFLLDLTYKGDGYTETYIKDLLKRLAELGAKNTVLTGISFSPNELGVMGYNAEKDEFFDYFHRRIHVSFHGTGDIFSSTAAGALVRGLSLEKALALAADYTVACIARTMESPDHVQYGIALRAVSDRFACSDFHFGISWNETFAIIVLNGRIYG